MTRAPPHAAMLRSAARRRGAVPSLHSMGLELPDDRPPLPPLDLIDRVTRPFAPAEADYIRVGFDTYPRASSCGRSSGRSRSSTRRSTTSRASSTSAAVPVASCATSGRWPPRPRCTAPSRRRCHRVAARQRPFGRYAVLPPAPPSEYPVGRFDLVLAYSVFMHLDAAEQDGWLGELHGLTSPERSSWPRSTAGPSSSGLPRPAPGRRRRHRLAERPTTATGIVHVRDDHFIGSAHGDGYHTTFHAAWVRPRALGPRGSTWSPTCRRARTSRTSSCSAGAPTTRRPMAITRARPSPPRRPPTRRVPRPADRLRSPVGPVAAGPSGRGSARGGNGWAPSSRAASASSPRPSSPRSTT